MESNQAQTPMQIAEEVMTIFPGYSNLQLLAVDKALIDYAAYKTKRLLEEQHAIQNGLIKDIQHYKHVAEDVERLEAENTRLENQLSILETWVKYIRDIVSDDVPHQYQSKLFKAIDHALNQFKVFKEGE